MTSIADLIRATAPDGTERMAVLQGGAARAVRIPYVKRQTEMTALLKADLVDGEMLRTLGRTATRDGGDGVFIWVAGDATTANGGTVVAADEGGTGRWFRIWDGVTCLAEWFGAKLNNSGFNSSPAIQACLNATGMWAMRKGIYYGTAGITVPDYAVITGPGAVHCQFSINHATDHILSMRGVSGTSYLGGPVLRDFAIARSVTPTTPGSSANDITQGHGLHMFMVSNPIIRDVYTYNNLVEMYVSNVLTLRAANVRGIRQTGGGGDRWYGVYFDGVTGGGTFGGPSPNPSATISQPNMVAASAVGQSWNFYLRGAIQDLWLWDPEAAGGHKQIFIDAGGAACGDVEIRAPVMDGYKTFGMHIKDVPQGSSISIPGGWVAGASGATGAGVRIESSHGIDLDGIKGDGVLANTVKMIDVSDSTNLRIKARPSNYVSPFYAISMTTSQVDIAAHKAISGGGASGVIVDCVGGSANEVTLSGTATSQKWASGFSGDSTAAGYLINVARVLAAAVTDRVKINGTAVTTQGNVSGHAIINPGAGAML